MKKKRDPSFLMITFICAILGYIFGYLTFENRIYRLIVLSLFLLFSLYYSSNKVKLTRLQIKKVLMYDFIDQFILSLSIHKTINNALAGIYDVLDYQLKKELDTYADESGIEKIEYLTTYFSNSLYEAFLEIIRTYLNEGGEILDASSLLLKEISEKRSLLLKENAIHQSKLIELLVGWFFVFLIIMMLRYTVTDMYAKMLLSPFFSGGLILFYLLVLTSIALTFSIRGNGYKKSSKKRNLKYIETAQFVKVFTIFRMGLNKNTNVFKALEKVKDSIEGPLTQELQILLSSLNNTISVAPFVSLGEKFKEPLIKHILISVYQLMINGGSVAQLFEFNYLFDRLNEINTESSLRILNKKYENLLQLPMLGTGLLVILIMAGVISLIGSFLYV